jgi:hypothetical protein
MLKLAHGRITFEPLQSTSNAYKLILRGAQQHMTLITYQLNQRAGHATFSAADY